MLAWQQYWPAWDDPILVCLRVLVKDELSVLLATGFDA